jgi:pilus assembly protein Flp/PilA
LPFLIKQEGIIMNVFRTEEKGQGLVEYALILVLVAIVVLAILLLLGPVVGNVFSNIVVFFTTATGGGSVGYEIDFVGWPLITRSGAGVGCTYTATWVRVSVTQGGNPVSGVSVGGTVAVEDIDGNPITSFSIGGTTGGTGQASLTGSTSGACGGRRATVSISGGPSRSVWIP